MGCHPVEIFFLYIFIQENIDDDLAGPCREVDLGGGGPAW